VDLKYREVNFEKNSATGKNILSEAQVMPFLLRPKSSDIP
jgi:hypothetical protein